MTGSFSFFFSKNRNEASRDYQSIEFSVWKYEMWRCNIAVSSLHAHTDSHASGMGLADTHFHVATCLIKLFCRPNWSFWCTSFDVQGWERGVETVKPIKEIGLLLPQLCSPAADGNIEPNVLQRTRTLSSIYIFCRPPKLKTQHESLEQSEWSLRTEQGYLLCKTHKEMWGLVRAEETNRKTLR